MKTRKLILTKVKLAYFEYRQALELQESIIFFGIINHFNKYKYCEPIMLVPYCLTASYHRPGNGISDKNA